MKRRTRINYTPEQKAIIWDRYKQGDSLHDIARMFDRYHSSVMPTIHQTGGYPRMDTLEVRWLASSLEVSCCGRSCYFFRWYYIASNLLPLINSQNVS